MGVKDSIKNRLNELSPPDLEKISVYIDQILARGSGGKETVSRKRKKPYKAVREILKHTSLSSSDIIDERGDRIGS